MTGGGVVTKLLGSTVPPELCLVQVNLKSRVWDFIAAVHTYDPVAKKQGVLEGYVCTLCQTQVDQDTCPYTWGPVKQNTTVFWSHLRDKHPAEYGSGPQGEGELPSQGRGRFGVLRSLPVTNREAFEYHPITGLHHVHTGRVGRG